MSDLSHRVVILKSDFVNIFKACLKPASRHFRPLLFQSLAPDLYPPVVFPGFGPKAVPIQSKL
jgi:hypothetical protein